MFASGWCLQQGRREARAVRLGGAAAAGGREGWKPRLCRGAAATRGAMPLPAARPRALPGSASAANARGFMPARRALLAGRASRAMSRARRCSWTRRGAPSRAASCHMQEISSQERPLPSLLTLYNRGLPRGRCRRAERLFSAHRAQLAVAPYCEARAHWDLSWPISYHPAVRLHPFDGRGPSAATATRAPPPPAASWALHAGGRLYTRFKVFGDRRRLPGARTLFRAVLSAAAGGCRRATRSTLSAAFTSGVDSSCALATSLLSPPEPTA